MNWSLLLSSDNVTLTVQRLLSVLRITRQLRLPVAASPRMVGRWLLSTEIPLGPFRAHRVSPVGGLDSGRGACPGSR